MKPGQSSIILTSLS